MTSHWISLDESPPPERILWRTIDESSPVRGFAAGVRWLLSAVAAAAGILIVVGALGQRSQPPPAEKAPEKPAPPPAEPAAKPPEKSVTPPEPARTPYSEELADLDGEISAPEGREEFRLVFEILGRARKRHEDPVWTGAVDQRTEAVRSKVSAHFAFLEPIFKEAQGDEAARIRDRVTRWGLPEFVARLDPPPASAESVAATAGKPAPSAAPSEPKPVAAKFVIPTEPPRSPEAKAYLDDWKRAAARATLRDFDAALTDLRRTGRSYAEEEVRREAGSDQEDLRRAAAVLQEAAEALARCAPGSTLTLEHRDASGAVRKVTGAVVRNDLDRAELTVAGARETVFVEYADTTAATLVEYIRGRSDARSLALLCLLEGATDAAARLLEGRPDAVPAKYWAYSEAVRVRPPAADPAARRQEDSARHLYYAAEREFRSAHRRGQAVEKYRILAKDFFDTALVRRSAQRIAQRSEACKEYLLVAAGLRASGTFQRAERPAIGACWTAKADTDLSRGHLNFVEVEFYALTEAPYRCWVQAGACCVESFICFFQTTDLVAPHPTKPGVTLAVEPGTLYGLPIAPPGLPLLKAGHADHAAGKPKEPAAWTWLEVPLPKYPAAGVKKLRIMTHQQGFSVARVVVSSTRKAPPTAAEVTEMEAARD